MFFKSKTTVSEADVLKALSEVRDPDLNRDVVALGFVKNLKIHDGEVSFQLELTTPACPVKDELKAQAETVVKRIPGVTAVKVEMTANVRSSAPQPNRIALPGVRHVVAIASGKGGVGKSTVTANLALALARTGARVGLLDADIYGPSIPLMMGARREQLMQDGARLQPVVRHGLKLMSIGFAVPEDKPVIWRGPMVHGALTQFLTQVDWGELDYLLIDMPPGTGDAQLTISQNAPLTGAIIVTTPQEVSLLDARKGLMMFRSVSVPVLGIIENMSGFVCGHCHQTTDVFLKGGGEKMAEEAGVPLLGRVPLDPTVAQCGDSGTPVVAAHPEAPVAKIYSTVAGKVAAALSIAASRSGENFQPVSLEWK